ncbi:MAG: ATP-binding protein [Myxococcales bacterium]|nr:ATP-binding protein [Myxococcales bacterium]MDD9968035.1 ATP-binding protein [Myxococcales bacterium]
MHLGLRTQLVLALGLVFVLFFALLAMAIAQLTRRSSALDQARQTERVATLLAAHLAGPGLPGDLERRMRWVKGRLGLESLVFQPADGEPMAVGGQPARAADRTAESDGGARVLIWLPSDETGVAGSLGRLLVFYVAVTVGAALLLSVLLLTLLIVRPLESVTHASERLAAGDLGVQVPVSGAAELSGLATSFNRMAAQLRRDREALEAQVVELQRADVELRATQDQLVHGERLASIGRLAAGVAHEIGNPLSAVLGLLELLEGNTLSAAQRSEFLGRIHAETDRINGIIRGLLDFARRDASGSDALGPVQVEQVSRDAVALVRHRRDAAQVQIVEHYEAGLPVATGIGSQLTQVLLNLLLNAVDALSGSGTISVAAERTDGGLVEVSVSDTGTGIDPEIIGHLFEPFVTTKPPGSGTGLGLAVAHALIERMGGQLLAENLAQGGARFSVRLREHAASPDGS